MTVGIKLNEQKEVARGRKGLLKPFAGKTLQERSKLQIDTKVKMVYITLEYYEGVSDIWVSPNWRYPWWLTFVRLLPSDGNTFLLTVENWRLIEECKKPKILLTALSAGVEWGRRHSVRRIKRNSTIALVREATISLPYIASRKNFQMVMSMWRTSTMMSS